jgi:hypothetical protein
MGSGCYSSEAYENIHRSRGYSHKSESELFCNTLKAADDTLARSFNTKARVNNTNVRKEMLNVGVRESRDTTEHPYTTPFNIFFDVTGSMGDRPQEMIKTQFPKLMDKLIQIGVKDPQLLFGAVGDTVYDDYPLQAGQFESDTEKILDSIQNIHIERGGGGNWGSIFSNIKIIYITYLCIVYLKCYNNMTERVLEKLKINKIESLKNTKIFAVYMRDHIHY